MTRTVDWSTGAGWCGQENDDREEFPGSALPSRNFLPGTSFPVGNQAPDLLLWTRTTLLTRTQSTQAKAEKDWIVNIQLKLKICKLFLKFILLGGRSHIFHSPPCHVARTTVRIVQRPLWGIDPWIYTNCLIQTAPSYFWECCRFFCANSPPALWICSNV